MGWRCKNHKEKCTTYVKEIVEKLNRGEEVTPQELAQVEKVKKE